MNDANETKLRPNRDTAEIGGETVNVVGEATGNFPPPTPPVK
jgi:hypothetical protein